MILVADSGSTKCDWLMINAQGETLGEYSTMGLNPYFHSPDEIEEALKENSDLFLLGPEISKVFFYGAGSSNEDLNNKMKSGLNRVFVNADILVDHDLVGAAYAAYDGVPNITCIMGTGSNSCFFDGAKVREEIPSLAILLGDEASGSYFGKKLLRSYFYKKLPQKLHDSFTETYQLSKEELIHRVYNEPHSNVYLASFMKFLGEHSDHPLFQDWVKNGIQKFIQIHVKCFPEWESVPVNFIGSVGYYFEDCLRIAAEREGITVGKIIKKPIYSLVNYHINTILQNNHA